MHVVVFSYYDSRFLLRSPFPTKRPPTPHGRRRSYKNGLRIAQPRPDPHLLRLQECAARIKQGDALHAQTAAQCRHPQAAHRRTSVRPQPTKNNYNNNNYNYYNYNYNNHHQPTTNQPINQSINQSTDPIVAPSSFRSSIIIRHIPILSSFFFVVYWLLLSRCCVRSLYCECDRVRVYV